MAINLEEHKVYVDSLKMDMVPLSVALQAVQQATSIDAAKYAKDLEYAMTELHNALNNVNLDD